MARHSDMDEYQKQGGQEIQLACKGIAIRPTTRYLTAAMRARYWNDVFKAMKKITLKLYNYPNNQQRGLKRLLSDKNITKQTLSSLVSIYS